MQSLVAENPTIRGLRLYVDQSNVAAQHVYTQLGMNGEHYRVVRVDEKLSNVHLFRATVKVDRMSNSEPKVSPEYWSPHLSSEQVLEALLELHRVLNDLLGAV